MSYGFLLIYDTGDLVFESLPEALMYADVLRRKGHKLDRIQTNVNLYEGHNVPKVVVDFRKKK